MTEPSRPPFANDDFALRTIDQRPPSLTAHLEERILAPLLRTRAARARFMVSVLLVLLAHVGLLCLFLKRDKPAETIAQREPTSVEVVVEKPPEPPKPRPAPPLPPKPQQEIEKPATSAPREANDTKVDTTAQDKETHAPKAAAPPTDGQPQPAKEAASPTPDAADAKAEKEAQAKDDTLKKDAEALDKAAPEPKPKPKKIAKAPPRAKAHRAPTALAQLSGASDLPDYKFARPTKKAPITGGNEDARYLAIVYGMIMRHRSPVGIPAEAGGDVTIAFTVDDDGNVVGMGVERSSGFDAIDEEAKAAIQRASPFPPPPAGAPHGLIATIDYGSR